jgi:hypothetical protein
MGRYILKNRRVDHERFEYIIFDENNRKQTRITDTLEVIKDVCKEFNLELVSPLDAFYRGYFSYGHVKLKEF